MLFLEKEQGNIYTYLHSFVFFFTLIKKLRNLSWLSGIIWQEGKATTEN